MTERKRKPSKMLRVLIVEDSPDDAELIELELHRNGYRLQSERVDTQAEMRQALEKQDWNIVLSDHAMPQFSSAGVLSVLEEFDLKLPCIIVSGAIGEEAAVTLMKRGMVDYVNKSQLARLSAAVERALRETALERAREQAEAALKQANNELEARVEARTAELQAEMSRRTETEAALRESEVRFAKMFHASPAATAIFREKDLHYLDANESYLRMIGYSREEVIGYSPLDLGLVESRAAGLLEGEALKRGGEAPLRTKTGETLHLLTKREAVELNGEPCLLSTVTDITERKRTETALLEAIQSVMKDASWFAQSVMDKLAQLDDGGVESSSIAELTPREKQVLEYIAQGKNNKQIARALDIGDQTVRNYISRIYTKLNVHSRAETIVWARERGLVGDFKRG